jgi:hypothetical protein
VRLLRTQEARWGRDSFDLSFEDSVANPLGPVRIEFVFGSGCGNCGGYRARAVAKGDALEGAIFRFASKIDE